MKKYQWLCAGASELLKIIVFSFFCTESSECALLEPKEFKLMQWDHKQSSKEVIRHFLFKTGTHDFLNAFRRRRGFLTEHLGSQGPEERFREIYKLGVWIHAEGQESRSGLGSVASNTRRLSKSLPEVLQELDCNVLLDVGCGDWNWMANVKLPCAYIGVDIVPEVIEANKRYERQGVRFLQANAGESELPPADAALCREVLFHLSFEDAIGVLSNIQKSARWLIATTDTSIWFNSDIPTGDYRKINLQHSPYNFSPPYKIIPDDALSPGRVLGYGKLPTCGRNIQAANVTGSSDDMHSR